MLDLTLRQFLKTKVRKRQRPLLLNQPTSAIRCHFPLHQLHHHFIDDRDALAGHGWKISEALVGEAFARAVDVEFIAKSFAKLLFDSVSALHQAK